MAESESKPKTKRRRVRFSVDAPAAGEVILTGDFAGWDLKKHPMKRAADGTWHKILLLPASNYQYKFLIDGQWRLDPGNDQWIQNCFGTRNNVLKLAEG